MKIISKPNSENWKHEHQCSHCDAKLELSESDIKYKYYEGDFRDPSYDTFYAICCVCNMEFIINENIIPKLLKIKLKTAYKNQNYSVIYDR